MRVNTIAIFFISILCIGCKFNNQEILTDNTPDTQKKSATISKREYSIMAVLWQQHAAEYKALAYQAYNTAHIQLDNIMNAKKVHKKPLAIVTDIDETVLNNSPYNGKMIALDEDYSKERWIEWGKEKKATLVPGSLGFFKYAKEKGVEVFYISNRMSEQKKETIENLKALGFPFVDDTHVLLREGSSGKKERRLKVEESHQIIMLLGDNLSDFSDVFENKSTENRNESADANEDYFGTKFIVFPNPMYGDWETKGILEKRYDWTDFQKDSIRRNKIISY